MNKLISIITSQAGWVLVLVGAITVVAILQIVNPRTGELRLAFDPSTNALLPEGDSQLRPGLEEALAKFETALAAGK